MYYKARYYDASLGRFVQADTLVPQPGNPQAFNRYAYAGNNPLRYIDPSGHQMTDWDWQNRWYEAHGYEWDSTTNFWTTAIEPRFADVDIAREVIAEAGITLGGWNAWSDADIYKVASGVARYGQKMGGGVPALKGLLGGGATIQIANHTDIYCGFGKSNCAPPSTLRGQGDLVLLKKGSFDSKVVVHELAHVIDWQNNFSREWMDTHDPLTNYAKDAPNVPILIRRNWEMWAEAVTVYVYGHYDASGNYVSDYKTAEVNAHVQQYGINLNVQMSDMQAVLEGW